MMSRCFAIAILAGAIGVAPSAGAAQPTSAAPPYELNVLLPITGPAAFLGASEQKAMQALESLVNRTGGIRGRPLKFKILDEQSNPAVAVQLVDQLIAAKVPAFLGPGNAATCAAVAPLVQAAGPLSYCFSPAIHPAVGSFQFSASTGSPDNGAVLIRFFRLKGWTRFGLVTSTDASGQDFDRLIDGALALPENKTMVDVDHEHFAPADVSVSAQIARIAAAKPQAIIIGTVGTSVATALRAIHDNPDLNVPVLTPGGNMLRPQMLQYASFLPKDVFFPNVRGLLPKPAGQPPVKEAMKGYLDGIKSVNANPDSGTSLVWDPTLIVVDALRALGPEASAAQLKAGIENLHGWAGINGFYDFRDGNQRGIGQDALLIYRWDPDNTDFVVVSKAAGNL